ncbi:ribonuclease like 2 precursor [Danio rerio]|uniref:RNase 2 n=1 Tax=Danio rerio TaxID=7955 RepID=A5HAK1_DANRE|nr:ribonuclease like 2 precursor [Danio rerio]AAI66036.1 Ribonuclease like 2 [Danio rerio]AAI67434.1 Ribonuclease like 2 [Danio rerio]ABQ23784.1 RNase 2 [Danio rerio]|eukprot:NP_001093575.1 ribonuclease like 2 precursor [Danio rerio]
MEILQSAVIFLLVFSFSFTVKVPDNESPYEKFLRQHVDPDMSVQKCNSEISKRKITAKAGNDCKKVNTFIQANKRDVNAVCGNAGNRVVDTNLTKSNQPFPVVTCQLKSGERRPHCQYRGRSSTRYIVLRCDKGWPVHYDEGIIDVNSSG